VADEKKYTVTTPDYETTVSVWFELTADEALSERVPPRPVEIANARKNNPRNTEYWLTDAEAEELRQDPRVEAVEQVDIIPMSRNAIQSGTFSKTQVAANDQDQLNWGLVRHIQTTNTFGTGAEPSGTPTYDYVLDGTGVDVVVIDSGIKPDHPDLQDADGVSRVKQIDWYAESGVSGTLPTGFYTDFDGHGTQCASVMAGKRMGWAKNADIYSIKLAGLEGGSDPNSGISVADTYDVILGWHNAKTNGRPTVINNSWSYVIFWDTANGDLSFDDTFAGTKYAITGGVYRGTGWSGSTYDTSKGHIGAEYNTNKRQFPYRVASVDADMSTLSSAGIVIVNAAGNDSQKVDLTTGTDYNNYVAATGLGNYHYHRGGSPYIEHPSGFEAPALDASAVGGENAAGFSNRGPATLVYTAGENITAAGISGFEFFGETGYTYSSVSGTSFSAPQIAGMCALLMQVHPDWTPQQVTKWFVDKATKNALQTTGLDDDYTSSFSLLGGQNNLAYFPMNGQVPFRYQSS